MGLHQNQKAFPGSIVAMLAMLILWGVICATGYSTRLEARQTIVPADRWVTIDSKRHMETGTYVLIDRERGKEYIVVWGLGGGVAITPRQQ